VSFARLPGAQDNANMKDTPTVLKRNAAQDWNVQAPPRMPLEATSNAPHDDGAGGRPRAAAAPTPRYVRYTVALLAVVNVFNYMDRMAISVLLPSIKADILLSDSQLGLLVGFAFSLFYAVCGIPIARWADRRVRRNVIAAALAIWSVMTALSGVAQNFWQLFAARVGMGIGEAGCLSPAQSIICDCVPLRRRAGILAIHSFGLIVGMMIGLALSGWLAEIVGWRMTFVLLGLPGTALAVVVRLTLREPIRGFFDAQTEQNVVIVPLSQTVAVLWRCKTYRRLVVVAVLNGFVQYGLNLWWPSFYIRSFGMSRSSVGVYLAVAIGAGAGIGMLIGGLLANRSARRDVRVPLKIGALATCFALPSAIGSLFVTSATVSIVLLGTTVLLWSVAAGPIVSAIFSVLSPYMRATAGSFSVLLTSIFGFGLGPFCVGLLSDVLAPSFGYNALRYALLLPVCLIPAMVVGIFAAAKTLPDDLRAAGQEV
jgi:predicted MFS family arabinose efflux permease